MFLIEELVRRGIIDKKKAESLENKIKNENLKEEEVILDEKITTEDFLFNLKSEILKIPLKNVSPNEISLKSLEIIPQESAKYYKMIPLKQDGNHFDIGMVYPDDLKAREALDFLSRQNKFSYDIFLITPSNFEEIFKKYSTSKEKVSEALEELEGELEEKKIESLSIKTPKTIERVIEEAPIAKIVAVILRHGVEGNASDIHIEPSFDKVRVRFRLDGVLHASIFPPLNILPALVARIKILSNLKIDETRAPQDGRFSAKFDDKIIDFRVSTFPTVLGEKVAIRILDPSKRKINFESLGISGPNLEIIKRAIEKPYGMILSTGPTGSGKTTTLYAILNFLNKEGVNVMTLEDPVEYFIDGVNQSQINPDIGYTFATGLRHMLRQDPDVLMVGEIRDEETASLAVHSALTGHIVLSTLHTSNAVGTIPRLIDMGIKPFLISPTLSIVIAQRLVRTFCPYCKEKEKPNSVIREIIENEINNLPLSAKKNIKLSAPFYIYKAKGCEKCHNSGYSGRIGVFEILEMNDRISEIILKQPSENVLLKEARRQGMITMKQDGILKALEGITSIEEVLRVAEEK